MTLKRILLGTVASTALVLSVNSMANNTSSSTSNTANSGTTGLYIGGNIGWGVTDEAYGLLYHNDFVWGIDGGYEFTKNWAIETGYTQMSNSSLVPGYTIENHIVDLAVKGTYHFDKQFSIFGKIGAAYTSQGFTSNSDDSYDSAAAYFGAGVAYNFTPHIAVNLQSYAAVSGDQTSDMFGTTAGLQYTF